MADTLQEWISNVEHQREDLNTVSDALDGRPPKRRRLSDHIPRGKRARSDAGVDYTTLVPSSPSIKAPDTSRRVHPGSMSGAKRTVGPPDSSSTSRNTRLRRSSQGGTESIESPSSSNPLGVLSSAYRVKILRPNGVTIHRSAIPLPGPVHVAMQQYEHDVLSLPQPSNARTHMTLEQAASLADSLENEEAKSESNFCGHLLQQQVFPVMDVDGACYCVNNMLFRGNGLPRSDFPESYYPISTPKPDYAYGYNDSAFGLKQQAVAQSSLYELYNGLYWPFLIIEAKSQAMGRNCYQAANQCAAGGTLAVNAIATLLDRAYPAPAASGTEPHQQPEASADAWHPSDALAPAPLDRLSVSHLTTSSSTTLSSYSSSHQDLQATPNTQPSHQDQPHENAPGDPLVPSSSSSSSAITFSLALDSMTAGLYIHWRSIAADGSVTFHLQRHEAYLLIRPNELIQLQQKLRQIVAWGTGPRLAGIRKALDILIRRREQEQRQQRRQDAGEGAGEE